MGKGSKEEEYGRVETREELSVARTYIQEREWVEGCTRFLT